jgi:hypothetical protein
MQRDRELKLNLVVANTRFFISPGVHIKNLVSTALSLAAKRIRQDWQSRYGYKPVLLETFVEPDHYRGVSYQAANWIRLGGNQRAGPEYEHCFSYNWNAMKGYHFLMRLAHLINILALNTELLAKLVLKRRARANPVFEGAVAGCGTHPTCN